MQGVHWPSATCCYTDSLHTSPRFPAINSSVEVAARIDCHWKTWIWPCRLYPDVQSLHDRGGRGLQYPLRMTNCVTNRLDVWQQFNRCLASLFNDCLPTQAKRVSLERAHAQHIVQIASARDSFLRKLGLAKRGCKKRSHFEVRYGSYTFHFFPSAVS